MELMSVRLEIVLSKIRIGDRKDARKFFKPYRKDRCTLSSSADP